MDQDRQQKADGYSKWRTFGIVTLVTIKWLFIFGLLIGLFTGGISSRLCGILRKGRARPCKNRNRSKN